MEMNVSSSSSSSSSSLSSSPPRVASPSSSCTHQKLTASLISLFLLVWCPTSTLAHAQLHSCSFNHFCSCIPLPNSLTEIHCFAAPVTSVPSLPSGQFYRVTISGSSEIHELTSDVFANATVSSFSLTGSKLSELEENSFAGTESTLTTLDLSDNHLRVFPTAALVHLPLLQWLSLRGNEIEDLKGRDLAPLANDQLGLRTLLLSDNRVSIIADGCFTRLAQLESLDLAGNMITRLEGRPFPSSLTSLSLSQNLLESIPTNALANLGNLTWLQLRGNLIKSLPVHWFLPSTSLDILDLSHNLLSHFTKDVFTIRPEESALGSESRSKHQLRAVDDAAPSSRVTIGDLHLDFNVLEDLAGDSFTDVAIRRLSLSNNKLSSLNNSLFNGPLEYSLQAIDLSFNLFTAIPSAVSNLKRITSFFVKGNQVTHLSEELLLGCKDHLQSLDLSANSFTRIPSEGLRWTSRLLRLNLQDNVISKVQESDLSSWANGLLSLSLAKNNLESISVNAFRHTKNLKELRLSFNQIHHTSTQALAPLRHTLVLLELTSALAPSPSSNSALLMKDISLLSRLEWLDLDLNSLKSLSVDSLTSLPNLLHVDLEGNRMSHLPAGLFSGRLGSSSTSSSVAGATTTTTTTSKLRNVLLSDNELSSLPSGLFHGLNHLMNIALTGNKLTHIEGNTFHNLPSLQNVFLNRNKITSIASGAFTKTNSLSNLYLQENHLRELPMDFVVMDSRVLLDARMVSEGEMEGGDESEVNTSEVNRNGFPSSTFTRGEEQPGDQLPTSHGLYINVSYNQLTRLGWSQSELHVINSSYSSAATASTTSSSKLPVRILDASHNNISQLGWFHPFCDRLDSLFLAHNQLSQLPLYSLSKCERLSTLNLNNNRITSLSLISPVQCVHTEQHTHDGQGMKQLNSNSNSDSNSNTNKNNNSKNNFYSSNFSNCIQQEVDGKKLKKVYSFPSLQILDLSHNEILNVSLFTPLLAIVPNLKQLDLSFNRIDHLADGLFSFLPSSLEVLSLAGNTLVTLPPLNHGSALRTLDLSWNRLTKVPIGLDESSSLVVLKITANRLSSLNRDLLRPFRSLKELYINGNPLHTLDTQVLSPLVNVQLLDISNCSLEQVSELPLGKLLDLRMSNNKISNISSFLLSKARRLKHLDISHNSLVDVPRNVWRFVPGLINLDISFNPIEVLDTTSLTSLGKLRNLDMTGLSLKYVDSRLLYPLRYLISIKTSTYPAVRSFRLHDLLAKSTSLRSVSITVQESILSHQIQWAFGSKLQELVITGSNLVTILPDAFLGLYRTSGLVLRITKTNVTQLPPGLLRYLSNRLTLIDLRHNRLRTLNPEVLEFQGGAGSSASSAARSGSSVVAGAVRDGSRLHFSNGLLLGDNPWICSCNLVWLSQWLRRWAKETRKAYAFSVDMDPSHWSSLFDVSCTTSTSDQNALRAHLIEFQRDIQVTCSPVSWAHASTRPVLPLILATFVTLFASDAHFSFSIFRV